VFAVAGIIGADETWDRLEAQWVARTGGVPFHANHCDSDQGDYASTSHSENKALYRDLAIMLAQSGLGGYGFAINLAAQRRIFPDGPDIAYYKCFIEVVGAMKTCAANNRETVKFSFDTRQESEHNAGILYGMFREAPEWKDHTFSELSFLCSREHPKVQAADLFARETMKAADTAFGHNKREARKSWLTLRETDRFHIEAIGAQWFENLKRQMPALDEVTGMSATDYREWLKKHRLHHCTTTMFRYMEWCEQRDQDADTSQ
jgi:hypothetical protein